MCLLLLLMIDTAVSLSDRAELPDGGLMRARVVSHVVSDVGGRHWPAGWTISARCFLVYNWLTLI